MLRSSDESTRSSDGSNPAIVAGFGWLEARVAPFAQRFGNAPAVLALREALPISFGWLSLEGDAGGAGSRQQGPQLQAPAVAADACEGEPEGADDGGLGTVAGWVQRCGGIDPVEAGGRGVIALHALPVLEEDAEVDHGGPPGALGTQRRPQSTVAAMIERS